MPALFSVPVPSCVLPSENVTVPVGVPPVPETVAVTVTLAPVVMLVAEALNEVAEGVSMGGDVP